MVTDRESGVADRAGEQDLRAAEDVRETVKSLAKYINGRKIYARNNPTLERFATEFYNALRSLLDRHGEVVLGVDQHTLRWEGNVVYDNEKRDESIAFVLYKDGIGEVSIHADATSEEVDAFVDILKDELHNSGGDATDIVTRLWKADFEHINYRVLDEYLVGQYGDGTSGSGQGMGSPLESDDHKDIPAVQDAGRVIVDTGRYEGSIEQYVGNLVDRAHPGATGHEREEAFQRFVESMFSINSEEMRLYREERQLELERDTLVDFLEAILAFTLLDNSKMFRDLSNVVDGICNYIIAEAQPETLVQTLLTIRSFSRQNDMTAAAADYFEKLEERFVDTELLLSLGKSVENWSGDASTNFFAYLFTVGRRCLPALCHLLEDMDHPRAHQAACDVLAGVAAEDVPAIIEGFNIDNPYIARDIVYLIRTVETDTIPPIVNELMFYPDLRVREEVISLLADVGSEDAVMMLIKLLDHDDKSTRIKVLNVIEDIENPMVANRMMSLAFDRVLGERSQEEREQVFRALGKTAGTRALPDIERMLSRKNPFAFGRNQKQQDKILAIRALEHVSGARSARLLRALSEDSNGLVRNKAQRALKVLRAARDGEPS